jgi:ADP-dependent phosphofructokinase/glucokinase
MSRFTTPLLYSMRNGEKSNLTAELEELESRADRAEQCEQRRMRRSAGRRSEIRDDAMGGKRQ